ncbi:Ig-like domain-containing protein [Nocardioides sp. BYT-33-1]|uniref:Ig-like domain-containing protein n=1 Tax=Nocardioides sp. BYT-33-1 TaxID=3416952 RepID=UPI003F53240E
MKLPRIALAAALAASGALVITGAATTLAPAAQAATVGCDALTASGYRQSTIGTDMHTPRGIDVDGDGVVYVGGVSDDGSELARLTPSGDDYTKEGTGGAFSPYGLAVGTDGTIYVADTPNGKVERLTLSGGMYYQGNVAWGLGGSQALDVDGGGVVYVGDVPNQRVVKLTPGQSGYAQAALQSTAPAVVTGIEAAGPTTMFVTASDDTVRVLDKGGAAAGTALGTDLSSPHGLDLDSQNRLVVADTGNDRVVMLTLAGPGGWNFAQSTLPATGLSDPYDVAVDEDDNIYVSDTGNDRVVKLTPLAVAAEADAATTAAGDAVTTDVLTNDSARGADLADAPTIARNPAHGTATVNPNGTITYTPAAGFSGTDTYTYAVRDTTDTVCATAKVTVTVTQGNACDPLGTTGGHARTILPAGIDYPGDIEVDADGSVLVPDPDNDQIVRLTPTASGYVRSVAVSGLPGVSNLAIADDGTLYVTSWSTATVVRLTPSGSTYTSTTVATGSDLSWAAGIDVADNGDLYVITSDVGGAEGRLLRLSAASSYGQQVLATGLEYGQDVELDDDGQVFVLSADGVQRLEDLGNGSYDLVTVTSSVQDAEGLGFDGDGRLYVADTWNRRILVLTPSGSGWTESELPGWGDENGPSGVAVGPDGTVFATDASINEVVMLGPARVDARDDAATVGANGSVTTDVRANDIANAVLGAPSIVDAPGHGTAEVNDDGTVTYTPTPGWTGTDHYDYLIRDEADQVCAVARVSITVTTSDGCGDIPSKEYGYDVVVSDDDFSEPAGVATDPRNFVFISDPGGAEVAAWAPGAGPSTIDDGQGLDPQGIAADAQGNVYYADEGDHEIVKLTWSDDDGDYTTRTVLAGDLQRPAGVAVDADGNVFFTERSSGHVHRLTPSGGSYTSSLVASGLDSPRGVAVDADGNLFVVDRGNGRVVKLTPSGPDYALSVVSTSVSGPIGVAVRPDGVVLVADTDNRRLLQLTPNGSGYAQSVAQRWDTRTPTWIAAPDNDRLIVADPENDDILMMVAVGITAEDDTAATTVATPVTTDVHANDVGVEGVTAVTTVSVQPDGGTASAGSDGRITYTPQAAFSGTDHYVYQTRVTVEGTAEFIGLTAYLHLDVCDSAEVGVTVQNAFVPGAGVSTMHNQPVTTPLSSIATTQGKPLAPTAVTMVQAPEHGGLSIDAATGAVTYSPTGGYSGSDSYVVEVCDTATPRECADITVPVTVGANTVIANDDTAATTAGDAVVTDVRDNDTSASAQAWAAPRVTSDPTGGTATVSDGNITFTPDAGFSGVTSYDYEVCDTSTPTPVCDEATVTVTVDNVFTTGASVTTAYNTPVTTGLDDLATVAGSPLAPAATTSITSPEHGSIAIDPATGAVTYSPAHGFSGTDSYVVEVCDTAVPVQCAEAVVEVTVQPKPSPTSGPTITVHAPDRATLRLTKAGQPRPLALTGSVTITGINPATRPTTARAAISGTATLYGPAKKASPAMCTPAAAVATVAFTPVNGTTALPPVEVTRPGHYTWVATTGADGDNTASTQSCASPESTTLVHRPAIPGKVQVKTGYTGVRADHGTTDRRIRPTRIKIPGIGLDARIETVGIRKRSMVIPTDTARGGWLSRSAAPGDAVGSTVIAGHVSDRGDRPGAFGRLRKARPGQVITVRTAGGDLQRYRIKTITTQPRTRGLTGTATSTTGEHQLTLVTCTGRVTYRNGNFHYTKNLVVTAVPLG